MPPKTITATCPLCCGRGTVTNHDWITGEPQLIGCHLCSGAGERQEPTTFDPPTTMSQTYVIFHSADYDGLFCGAIARRYFVLEDVTYIGWNFGEPGPEIPREARLYILDLSIPSLMDHPGLVWIDHHKSAIERYSATIPGYRIIGVSACRLAWQYFFGDRRPAFAPELPKLDDYVERRVAEPLAVRLAGEYDVWDKRDPRAELFQHGLDSCDFDWKTLLCDLNDREWVADSESYVRQLLVNGEPVAYSRNKANEKRITKSGFDLKWEGLTFLACNCGGGSFAFKAGIKPHHDAVLAFMWRGRHWSVSLYGVPGKPDVDLSAIAVRFPGGGGHKQACGFQCDRLPFLGAMSADKDVVIRELMIALELARSCYEHAERWSATNTERLDVGMSAAMQALHKHAGAVPDFQKDTYWADVRALSEATRSRIGR